MTNPGIVLCSRLHSRRIPNKPMLDLNGKPAIWHLCNRLLKSGYSVCLATSSEAEDDILHKATQYMPLKRFRGHRDNVLARFYWAAYENNFDPVIRVTHDDLFTDIDMMIDMVHEHNSKLTDYTYESECLRGSDCEIVSLDIIKQSLQNNGDKPIEYLSYAFRDSRYEPIVVLYDPPEHQKTRGRMVLDWPEDIAPIRIIHELLGDNFSAENVYDLLRKCPSLFDLNRMPEVTVYTCAYNAFETIERAIKSVLSQDYNGLMEYIIVDDASTDGTDEVINRFADHPNVHIIRNDTNMGLASSCNRALRDAKGKYFIRLDADDELLSVALSELTRAFDGNPNFSAMYPAYYQDGVICKNKEHHMGGAMIRASAYQEIKFCDGIRNWEGKEFLNRLSTRFLYMETDTCTWVYHKRPNSMSGNVTGSRNQTYKDFIECPKD